MEEKLKILYVDDEQINLKLFIMNMNKKYDVITAENGIKGLEVLANNPTIAIVVSDMKMPKMSGLEFIKLAKEKYPNISFFILTGYEITEEIEEALKSGIIQKYFRKPFSIADIDSSIKNAIQKL
jgi:two-component system, response regulator, stage 0 sporulation protein F